MVLEAFEIKFYNIYNVLRKTSFGCLSKKLCPFEFVKNTQIFILRKISKYRTPK